MCVDVWRIFANCVKYHTHPFTRDGAIVSFISIAMHLRGFFNALWLEYMVPSDAIGGVGDDGEEEDLVEVAMGNALEKREVVRKERLKALLQTELSVKCLDNAADALDEFVDREGKVDDLDEMTILKSLSTNNHHHSDRNTNHDSDSDSSENEASEEDSRAVVSVFNALSDLSTHIRATLKAAAAASNNSDDDDDEPAALDYTVDRLHSDVLRCYEEHTASNPSLRNAFRRRLDRLQGKLYALVLEVNGRGGNQSSIWGCMAAVIWAREATKKPYWPALVLGIMAPDDQREEWHRVVTERNEARLPEKLRVELQAGKRKAEQAIRRQSNGLAERMSFFLVEFLGTHEFIWIREADIIERFDANEDPNTVDTTNDSGGNSVTKKKKTSLRGQTPANERMHQTAVDEGKWAMQEFEMQLTDPCGDISEEDEEEEEENYTYAVLCESDDEADQVQGGLMEDWDMGIDALGGISSSSRSGNSTPSAKMLDNLEEIHELLATDGLLDYSVEGRKNAKKRAAALKKQQADAKREAIKKEKENKIKKARAAKKVRHEESSKRKAQTSKSKKSKEIDKQKRQSDLENKREQKELEKRRKKRERDRERYLKEEERKAKKMKSGDGNNSIVRRGRKLGIADKRGRASSIIRGYLNRIAAQDDLKGLGLNGVLGIPAASVEASGLLGMTLAFRAAAGEIEMPNTNDNPSIFKPWEKIDVDGPLTSRERCGNLEKQINLLEEAITKLGKDDLRRKELTKDAIRQKEKNDQTIAQAEKEARQNDMPKRKPFIRKKQSDAKDDNVRENKNSKKNARRGSNENDEGKDSESKQISGNDSVGYESPDAKDADSIECNETLSTQDD